MSHRAATNNLLLKITVPRRTGRKRKRGTDGPFEGEFETGQSPQLREAAGEYQRPRSHEDHGQAESGPMLGGESLYSQPKLPNPKDLLHKLRDNVGCYHVEAVGVIGHTHRYRGRFNSLGEFSAKEALKGVTQDLPTFSGQCLGPNL